MPIASDSTLKKSITPQQERHLERIKDMAASRIDQKYRRGALFHGGYLLADASAILLEAAIDEAVDQVVYLLSLRERLEMEKS